MQQPVGIVLVSHSAQLADGLADLVRQVAPEEVPVQPAGGTDDGRIGTSYEKVRKAIAAADRGAGVAVLADLGSSVLTTRAVLTDHSAPTVIMADAPFVEGAVAAAVLAATADLKTVVAAAEEARNADKL
ncbi:dihydroxyacetone kinase phosphoryl donor subunit DhaM [Spirillospora sp. CA-128828]|uniref:dihydroxyacetone kinase phosphoryl donor subunit DhaM n=1 Tax=Spirillospora sp. CA-128828 TaxID=3240033 RepID=UPI003D8F98E1